MTVNIQTESKSIRNIWQVRFAEIFGSGTCSIRDMDYRSSRSKESDYRDRERDRDYRDRDRDRSRSRSYDKDDRRKKDRRRDRPAVDEFGRVINYDRCVRNDRRSV